MKSASRFAAPLTLLAVLAGCREDSPAAKMRAIAPRGGRTIEARLTGFAWSPIRVQRGTPPLDPSRLELAGAAGAVIEKTPNGRDAGVGYLIIDRDADAVEALQEAAQHSPNDGKIWSDLAAARYTLAARGDKPYELPRALAAADHALRIDANLPDALFNRALIIERLGITEAARRAWQRYLQADGTSKWANEALAHLGHLEVINTRAQFERDLAHARTALAAGDAMPVSALARTFPQEARTWGEGPLLAEWADAVRAGNDVKGRQALDLVRAIGHALAEWNHQELLADAVASIDNAPPDRLATLVEAEVTYRTGRMKLAQRHAAEAEPLLERAAKLFASAGSAMSFSASYYAANAVYDGNRAVDAAARLQHLQATFDSQKYRGLTADILWTESLCEQALGDWETALRTGRESLALYTSLGETMNRGRVGVVLAWALDRAAQPRAAWSARVNAFPVLGFDVTDRIRGALGGAVLTEAERGEYEAALALSNLALHDLREEREPHGAQIFAHRARLLALVGDGTAATAAVKDARESAARIADASLRERLSMVVDLADAVVQRSSNPKASLQLLDRALQFYTTRNERSVLPDVYLERGRTHLALRDQQAALDDFESGIRELDALRSRLGNTDLRSGFYDSAADLFSESVELLLRRSEVGRAFALADSTRARSVYERLDNAAESSSQKSPTLNAAALDDDAVLIEYAILPDRLAIFALRRGTIAVDSVPINSVTLRRSVEQFADLLQRRADATAIRQETTTLSAMLIGSAVQRLAGAKRLIIVPDRYLHAVPFAALVNPATGRYLVEDFTISVAANASQRRSAPSRSGTALIIGDPTSNGTQSLPEAAREAEAIAAMYRSATVLIGDRATRSHFIAAARNCGIIHYAGHARSDSGSSFGSLRLVSDDDARAGDLDAADIARMPLQHGPLVVLAACGTIRGDSDHVEGMPSVARAFLAAGARGVVGTLWEIDDDIASQLFRRFHEQFSRGASAAEALRGAQIALLHSGDTRLQHPSTWAPVEVLGGDEPPAPQSR